MLHAAERNQAVAVLDWRFDVAQPIFFSTLSFSSPFGSERRGQKAQGNNLRSDFAVILNVLFRNCEFASAVIFFDFRIMDVSEFDSID